MIKGRIKMVMVMIVMMQTAEDFWLKNVMNGDEMASHKSVFILQKPGE
jgi:hypothetical protein